MRRFCIVTVLGLWLLADSAIAQEVDRAEGIEHAPVNLRVGDDAGAEAAVAKAPALRVVAQVDRLDDGSSLVPPVLTLVVGAATTVLGLGIGLGPVLSCNGHCEVSPWAGGLVVGGIALTTAGLLWCEWVIDERNQIEIRQRMLHLNALAAPSSPRWAL